MHELEQVGVGGPVGPPVGGGALHPLVDAAHGSDRGLGLVGRAEGGRADEPAGAVQSSERIAPVVGVVGDARHGERVHGLQQQGPDAADDHRRVGVDLEGGAVGTEQAGVVGEGHRPLDHIVAAGQDATDATAELHAEIFEGGRGGGHAPTSVEA